MASCPEQRRRARTSADQHAAVNAERPLFPLCAAVALMVLVLATSSAEAEPVTITLRSPVSSAEPLLRLGDIADLQGGSPQLRSQIAALDIDDQRDHPGPHQLTQAQIRLRLQLTDIASTAWVLVGPQTVTVEPAADVAASDDSVLVPVQRECARLLGLPASEIKLTLLYPLPPELKNLASEYSVRPIITGEPRLGRSSIRVGVFKAGELIRNYAISLELQRYTPVPIAVKTLDRGTELTGELVRWERRAVSDPDKLASESDFASAQTRQRVSSGQIIYRNHVAKINRRNTPTVAARGTVRVMAQRGALRVTLANGIALQAGSEGDTIRIKNPESGEVFLAEVVAPNQVQVRF